MAEYIEREAAKRWLSHDYAYAAAKMLDNIPAADVAPVVHGRWVINRKSEDGYTHHMCSKCKNDAPFHYTYVADYDEDLDGEWYYLDQREDGIVEYMGNYCPNCGARMDATDINVGDKEEE